MWGKVLGMLKITLDNSCFDARDKEILNKLILLQDNSKVKLYRGDYFNVEKLNFNNEEQKESDFKFARLLSRRDMDGLFYPYPQSIEEDKKYRDDKRGFSQNDLENIFQQIIAVVFPTGVQGKNALNHRIDIKTLAESIARKSDYFVNKDKLFHREDDKWIKIETTFPETKIRLLNQEFVTELLFAIENDK